MADHDEVHAVAVRVVDDLLGGMSDADLEVGLDAPPRDRGLQLGQHAVVILPRIFDHRLGLDVVPHLRRPRDREHVELSAVLFGQLKRRLECLAARRGTVVADQNLAVHGVTSLPGPAAGAGA